MDNQIPSEYKRSLSEQYFVLIEALRRRQPLPPSLNETFLNGLISVAALSANETIKKRVSAYVQSQ